MVKAKYQYLTRLVYTSEVSIGNFVCVCQKKTKTVTLTVAISKTKIVKQEPQQQTIPKDTERKDFSPIRPQPPLPNQQDDRDKR